jgi:hypothetical protein
MSIYYKWRVIDMKTAQNKTKMIHSVAEFKKRYLSEDVKEKEIENVRDAHDFGVVLANESIKKVKVKSL